MEPAHRTYLATQVLSEQATISYRNVARALNVHVNAAKRILYEFHAHENGKKPGSVHATYLVSGIKKTVEGHAMTNGHAHLAEIDDEPIPSSPPPFTSSMLQSSQQDGDGQQSQREAFPVRTITLAREEALDSVKDRYETVTSIHIYSLSPYRLQDLQTLTDIGRDLFNSVFVKEDPLLHNRTYGVIQNTGVRRRTGKRPPVSEAPAPKFKAVKEDPKQSTASTAATATSEAPPTLKKDESSGGSSNGRKVAASSTKQPALKRETSDIFKSFAKAKSKSKAEEQGADSPAQSGPEDTKMTDADEEGESEDEALFLDTNTRKPAKKRPSEDGDLKEGKQERAAKLRKMMDSDDDEPMPESNPMRETLKADSQNDDKSGVEDADEEVWSESDTERPAAAAAKAEQEKDTSLATTTKEEEEAADSEPRRRRGKRKVMKKKTMKDEEGYLVTKEEAVWESFSEDEPISQPKAKAAFPTKTQSQSQSKSTGGKAGGGKGAGNSKGGGSIMSFFGKK